MNNLDILNMIPDPDGLPVAAGWFIFLSYLTYYLHLLSTGTMFGISVMAVLGHAKGKKDDNWKALGNRMSKILPFAIAYTVNLGVAPLLFLQVLYGNFFYSASIVIGIPWLLLLGLIIIGYYSAYWLVFQKVDNGKGKTLFALLVTVILAWAGFMLVNVNTLMLVPKNWRAYFSSPAGMNLNWAEATLFPRYIFYIFLFLAVGGTFGALFYKIRDKAPEAALGRGFSGRFSAAFAVLSIPAFITFLLTLPKEIKAPFLAGSTLWTLLTALFLIGLAVVGHLSFRGKSLPAAIVLALDLVLFVLVRNHIRGLYLAPYKEKFSTLAQNTQYGVMALFFVILAAGLGLVAWLLYKTHREFRPQA